MPIHRRSAERTRELRGHVGELIRSETRMTLTELHVEVAVDAEVAEQMLGAHACRERWHLSARRRTGASGKASSTGGIVSEYDAG